MLYVKRKVGQKAKKNENITGVCLTIESGEYSRGGMGGGGGLFSGEGGSDLFLVSLRVYDSCWG